MKIPYHRQLTDFYCGPATLQMIFEYFGMHISQHELAQDLNTQKNGTKHGDLIRVAREKGLYCYVNQNSTIDEIQHYIEQRCPVIVNYMEPEGEPHYAIVTEYKNGKLILNDPWNGESFELLEDWFMDHWYDIENNAKQWIMAVSSHDFGIGKQFVPIRSDE